MKHSWQKMRPQFWIGGLVIVITIALQSPALISSSITNLVMNAYTRSLLQNKSASPAASQYEQLQPQALEQISNIWPTGWLGTSSSFVRESQIVYASEQGDYQQAIALAERSSNSLRQIPRVRDAVALAYLAAAEVSSDPRVELTKALSLRPDDLYANFLLWQDAQAKSASETTATYEEKLRHFTLGSLAPANVELMTKSLEIIPDLLDNGLWTQEEVDGVAAFLVWRHFDKESVIHLLRKLTMVQPDNTAWPFYLGELFQRRGEMALAESNYQAALALNPDDADTIQRIASLNEGARATEPDAPLVDSTSATGHDVAAYVAGQMGVPIEQVVFGENMVVNGRFKGQDSSIPDWEFRTYLGPSGNEGLYFSGIDDLYADTPARIIALRGGSLENNTTTYAEYWGDPLPITDDAVVTVVEYASDYAAGATGLVYLGEFGVARGKILINERLPNSDRQWKRMIFVSRSPGNLRSAMPLLRSWGSGQLWIRAIEIRPIFLLGES